jgi:hypothetical protein
VVYQRHAQHGLACIAVGEICQRADDEPLGGETEGGGDGAALRQGGAEMRMRTRALILLAFAACMAFISEYSGTSDF